MKAGQDWNTSKIQFSLPDGIEEMRAFPNQVCSEPHHLFLRQPLITSPVPFAT